MTTFKNIFGQDAAIDVVARAWRAQRLPHGLIFAGPVGVGKGSTASVLGQLFLCEKPNDITPCGTCESCRLIASGTHPDFHPIYRQLLRVMKKDAVARDLSIDVIRPYLIEPANRKPMMNLGKVFVVDQAELMSTAAQNSLLKTLEEPYGRTLIVLLTDQPHALLPTIRSRCQIVRFAALPVDRVEKELISRGIADPDARDAAQFAEGSLGIAMRWLEDDMINPARDLARQIQRSLDGQPLADLPDWLKKAADAYSAKQIERDEQTSKDQSTREGLATYFRLASLQLRRHLTQTDDPDSLERACAAIDAIVQAETYLESNVTISLVLQQLAGAMERALVDS